jgi:hypothetical protein
MLTELNYFVRAKLLVIFILSYSRVDAQPGRLVTPYFEGMMHYNYVIKGKIIKYKEISVHREKFASLQIAITDKLGQDIADTIWIEPVIYEGSYSVFDFSDISGEFYFAMLVDGRILKYCPDSEYSIIRINNGYVSTLFYSYDIFLKRIYFMRLRWNDCEPRKMKIDKFEKKLKKVLRTS